MPATPMAGMATTGHRPAPLGRPGRSLSAPPAYPAYLRPGTAHRAGTGCRYCSRRPPPPADRSPRWPRSQSGRAARDAISGSASRHTPALTAREKSQRHPHRAADAPADAVMPSCAVVLGDKGGKGVAEILHRHVGEGVDLDRRGEGRHLRGPKLFTQSPAPSGCQSSSQTAARRSAGSERSPHRPPPQAYRPQRHPQAGARGPRYTRRFPRPRQSERSRWPRPLPPRPSPAPAQTTGPGRC